MSLAIKLFCQLTRSGKPQVRRLRVPENCSLTDLLALIPHQVPDLAGLHFSLQYTDDEGDNITFALEAEWLECLAVNAGKPVLRLSLVPSKKEKAKEPQEVKPPVPELRPAPRCVLPSVPKTLPAPLLPAQSEVPARPGDVVEMEDDNSSIASSPCSGPAHGLEGFPSSDYELVNEAAAPTPDASLEPNPRELAQAAPGEEEGRSLEFEQPGFDVDDLSDTEAGSASSVCSIQRSDSFCLV
eukprot:TRINITY_DN671_c0_g1_i2.p1 TRINITY_DN671_c0_g1~~TRINITY_DN671_c0_g1_i2.p1  ORF type:complete len:241 (-),score=41.53 TRINITY_DN671_c0_g1_i2:362-1084(-)